MPRYFLILVAAMAALAPFALDTYLPAFPAMAEAFGTDIVALNFTVSTYMAGFTVGLLLGGPISDQIGRRPIGYIGLVAFASVSVAIALADNVATVQWLRPLQALGGGFVASIGNAMVRDSYPPTEAAKRFPIIMMVMLGAPLAAPVVGAALLPYGWASIFWFLAGYAAFVLVAFSTLGETNALRGRAVMLGKIIPQYLEVLRRRIDGSRVPLRYIATQGFVSSALMIYLTNISFVLLEYYEIPVEMFAVYFAFGPVAMMIFTFITSRLLRRVEPFAVFRVGMLAQLACVLAMAALVFFGEPSAALFVGAQAFVIGSAGLISPTLSGLHLANFKRLAGSAGALMSTASFAFGAVLGSLTSFFHDGTLKPIAALMVAAIVVANLIAWTTPAPKEWSDEALEGEH